MCDTKERQGSSLWETAEHLSHSSTVPAELGGRVPRAVSRPLWASSAAAWLRCSLPGRPVHTHLPPRAAKTTTHPESPDDTDVQPMSFPAPIPTLLPGGELRPARPWAKGTALARSLLSWMEDRPGETREVWMALTGAVVQGTAVPGWARMLTL